MIGLATFWDERVRAVGHTGWADGLVYRYDQPLRLRAIRRLLRRLGAVRPGTQVLEIGCGVGDFVSLARAAGATVTGVDVSEEACRLAGARFAGDPAVRIVHADLSEFTPAEASVDLVLSVTVLQHVIEPAALQDLLARLRRGLKPGGLLVALELAPAEAPELGGHVACRSVEAWRGALRAAGLGPIQVTSYPHWFVLVLRLLARLRPAAGGSEAAPAGRRQAASSAAALARRAVLWACRPLDYWLGLRVPTAFSVYCIFVARWNPGAAPSNACPDPSSS